MYSAGRVGEIDALVERAKQIPELGATRVIVNDPTDALLPHLTEELVERIGEATGPAGRVVRPGSGRHGAAERASSRRASAPT